MHDLIVMMTMTLTLTLTIYRCFVIPRLILPVAL